MLSKLVSLASLILLCSCWKATSPQQSPTSTPTVLATTTHIHELLKAIAHPEIATQSLMGPGVDPHLYRPTAKDMQTLRQAHAIFYHGLHFEGKMTDTLANLPQPTFAIAESIPKTQLITSPEGTPDPHVWFDPELWIIAAKTTSQNLSALFPQHKVLFETRLATWIQNLRTVSQELKSEVEKIPPSQRHLVTSHDAFQYLGRHFSINVHAIQGISTESEAALADIQAIIQLVKKHQIPAVFIESSISPATINQVKNQTNTRIGGELYSDSLGNPDGPTGTIAGVLRHNIEAFTKALSQP